MSKHEKEFKTLYLYVIEAIGTLSCQSKGFRVFYKTLGEQLYEYITERSLHSGFIAILYELKKSV